ncbi:unnamed protein product [Ranitomeya imitator]|uniref:Reticulon n=1 Tax=Ranitomeya imitator TaxID=111125 RepID=A0ABN9LR41_9NEOB|nr:unnamed protein product [Ranitomeya imitator]
MNPFQKYLDMEPILPAPAGGGGRCPSYRSRLHCALTTLRRLFLVQDTKESLKFLLLSTSSHMLALCVNGLTLLLLVVIGVFTFPVMYKHNQALVDRYVSMVTSRVAAFRAK